MQFKKGLLLRLGLDSTGQESLAAAKDKEFQEKASASKSSRLRGQGLILAAATAGRVTPS